jgi:NAD+ kinase
MNQFKHIAIVANTHISQVQSSVEQLAELLASRDINVLLEEKTAQLLSGLELPVVSEQDLQSGVDLVIVVGGDGSMLAAARNLVEYGVPLMGVNRGRLGFLNDILPDDIDRDVSRVLAGDYVESSRFLLEVEIRRGERMIGQGSALNDVVLHPGKSVRMMEFELSIDGKFVYSQRSDGLIVSTPTGSTAYALSGGGPILHPNLDAIGLVPMNPHTLTSRPIVVSGNSAIQILVGARNELHPFVTCDGQEYIKTEPGDMIHIRKMDKLLKLIHPPEHNFYQTCRSKLGWGSRLDSSREADQQRL